MAGRLTLDQLVEVRILCPQPAFHHRESPVTQNAQAFPDGRFVFLYMAALPTFLPLPEAARKYGLDEARIKSLIESGTIKAAMVDDTVIVSEAEVQNSGKPLRKEHLPEYTLDF